MQNSLRDSASNRFVLKATVYPSQEFAGFVGYGDADPSTVSLLVRGAEMRIAETPAVNRVLPGRTRARPVRKNVCVAFGAPGAKASIGYFVLSFCLATRRCMNLGPSFL